MDKILLAWHDLVVLESLMNNLVTAHVAATIIESSKPQSYMMLVSSGDIGTAVECLVNGRNSLELPDELIEQLNTRHGL